MNEILKLELINCKFINNRAVYGGALVIDGAKIKNCLFDSNYSGMDGGAILINADSWAHDTTIINSTFVNNIAEQHGSGINWYQSPKITLVNSILFGNSDQIYIEDIEDKIPEINNCAIEGELDFVHTGENNITLSPNNTGDAFSPYFSDPDNGNYMIQAGSPLRNAGIWTDDVPLYDLAGLERDSLPDIGCYEYDVTSIYNGQFTMDNCELYQNYPNPFNPSTNIRFDIDKTDKVELLLYNVAGQLVKKILDKELNAGNHSILFEASDLNSGMYYYTLKTENTKISRKMLLLK